MVAFLLHNQWLSLSLSLVWQVMLICKKYMQLLHRFFHLVGVNRLLMVCIYLWLFTAEFMVGVFLGGEHVFIPLNHRGIDPFLVALFIACLLCCLRSTKL